MNNLHVGEEAGFWGDDLTHLEHSVRKDLEGAMGVTLTSCTYTQLDGRTCIEIWFPIPGEFCVFPNLSIHLEKESGVVLSIVLTGIERETREFQDFDDVVTLMRTTRLACEPHYYDAGSYSIDFVSDRLRWNVLRTIFLQEENEKMDSR